MNSTNYTAFYYNTIMEGVYAIRWSIFGFCHSVEVSREMRMLGAEIEDSESFSRFETRHYGRV